jgi:Ca-activated chloride channel homolog
MDAATTELKLSCITKYPVVTASACIATCLVSLAAPDIAAEARAPVSISLVLDKSGSMAGYKLNLVKKTCKFLLQHLGARDSVSVVAYDSDVCLQLVPFVD